AAGHHRHAREPRRDDRRRSPALDEARRHRSGDRVAGVARADGDVGRAGPRRLDLAARSRPAGQFADSVTLSMQTVLLPALTNVNARPALLLAAGVKLSVKVCRLLLTAWSAWKIMSYGAAAIPTLR